MSANAEANQSQKLNWQFTFLIGFGFFGTSVMWALYNSCVPIFLQAGTPAFFVLAILCMLGVTKGEAKGSG